MISDLWRVMQADHDLVWDLLDQLTGGSGHPHGSPAEHRSISIKAGNTEFDECVNTVASHARQHITYEQNQIWPRLADHLTDPDADLLAARWVDARRRGPTRPHPHTPPVPWILGTHGYVVARIDRARDALTGRKVPTPAAISEHRPAVQR